MLAEGGAGLVTIGALDGEDVGLVVGFLEGLVVGSLVGFCEKIRAEDMSKKIANIMQCRKEHVNQANSHLRRFFGRTFSSTGARGRCWRSPLYHTCAIMQTTLMWAAVRVTLCPLLAPA